MCFSVIRPRFSTDPRGTSLRSCSVHPTRGPEERTRKSLPDCALARGSGNFGGLIADFTEATPWVSSAVGARSADRAPTGGLGLWVLLFAVEPLQFLLGRNRQIKPVRP